jgi:Holliday junction resolvasome RuvABC endonuclease subunit
MTSAYESDRNFRTTQLMDCAHKIVEAVHWYGPSSVWIENTIIGNNRKYSIQLSQMMGAVLAHLGPWSTIQGNAVLLVNIGEWKLGSVGKGNATKEMVRDYINSLDPSYAALCDQDQDRYDAAAIGRYGHTIEQRVVDRAIELELTDPG